jgi:integrase/recombinase XerD
MSKDESLKQKLKIIDSYLDINYINNRPETILYHKRKLKQYAKHLNTKSFKEATSEDVVSFIKKYSQSGFPSIKSCLINFYRYLYNLEPDERLPDCVRILKTQKGRSLRKQGKEIQNRERIVTPTEYDLLIKHSDTPFQKAMIETLYLFGPRISELLSMKATDVIEQETLTKIIVRESKTKPREITTNEIPQYLLEYFKVYQPFKEDSTKLLWASPYGKYNKKPMRREAVVNMIHQIRNKAGITKKITPHDFRHTAISRDLEKGLPVTLVEQKYGLVHGSLMIKTYDHNGSKELEDWYKNNHTYKPETPYAIQRQRQIETNENKIEIEKLKEANESLQKQLKQIEISHQSELLLTMGILSGNIQHNYSIHVKKDGTEEKVESITPKQTINKKIDDYIHWASTLKDENGNPSFYEESICALKKLLHDYNFI